MAKPGQNKNNTHAALKSGEFHRVHWTQGLSGDELKKFIRCFHLDTEENLQDEKRLQQEVIEKARKWFHEMLQQLPE